VAGQSYPAHKCIISASSPKLRSIISSQPDVREIELIGEDPFAIEAVLGYIYGESVTVDFTHLMDVIKAAKFYNLSDMMKQCMVEVVRVLDEDMAWAIFSEARDLV